MKLIKEPNNTSKKKSNFEIKNSMDVINIRLNTDKRDSDFNYSKFLFIFVKKHAKGSIQDYLKQWKIRITRKYMKNNCVFLQWNAFQKLK